MKTSASLLSAVLFIALPLSAQNSGATSGGSHGGGSHASGGGASHSSGSHGYSGGSSGSHFSSASSSGGGSYHFSGSSGGFSGRPSAPGHYVGSRPVTGSAAPVQRTYVRSTFIGSGTVAAAARASLASARPARPIVARAMRKTMQTQAAAGPPYATSATEFGFFGRHGFFDDDDDFGFHHRFSRGGFGCGAGFGFGAFNCFGGLFFGGFGFPLTSLNATDADADMYDSSARVDFYAPDQSELSEVPSAPGTYLPNAFGPAEPEEAPAPKPVTLVAFVDGSVYGVTDYWLDHGQLHYVPVYGGSNTMALTRVDLDKTIHLNTSNGVEFILRNAPSVQPGAPPSMQPLEPISFPELMF